MIALLLAVAFYLASVALAYTRGYVDAAANGDRLYVGRRS